MALRSARIFNFISRRLQKSDADLHENPGREKFATTSTYDISIDPRRSRDVTMEANRNADGSWRVTRLTVVIDRRRYHSAAWRPEIDAELVMDRVPFRLAMRRLKAFERNLEVAGFNKSGPVSGESDPENVHNVLERTKALLARQTPDLSVQSA